MSVNLTLKGSLVSKHYSRRLCINFADDFGKSYVSSYLPGCFLVYFSRLLTFSPGSVCSLRFTLCMYLFMYLVGFFHLFIWLLSRLNMVYYFRKAKNQYKFSNFVKLWVRKMRNLINYGKISIGCIFCKNILIS